MFLRHATALLIFDLAVSVSGQVAAKLHAKQQLKEFHLPFRNAILENFLGAIETLISLLFCFSHEKKDFYFRCLVVSDDRNSENFTKERSNNLSVLNLILTNLTRARCN